MLKQEVETKSLGEIRLTISGASEAHLLAKDLGKANIGVILSPPRSSPLVWEQRRMWACFRFCYLPRSKIKTVYRDPHFRTQPVLWSFYETTLWWELAANISGKLATFLLTLPG